jgi:hypothetical protein
VPIDLNYEGESGGDHGAPAKAFFQALFLLFLMAGPAWAATGCDLNSPDRDIPRLFPESTRYTSKYVSLTPDQLRNVVAHLGESFRALYDPLDVPYTIYEIYTLSEKVGYIHGVNQKGQFGGIQVFVALDMGGRIKSFYIQKMTGQSAGKFREAGFGRQFLGISLKDFDSFDPVSGKGSGRLAKIRNPAPEMETDFYGVLRALKKNLILMDELVYSAERQHR